MKNQIKYNFPALGPNQYWKIIGYLNGKRVNKTKLKIEDFGTLQFIGQSGDYYNCVADGKIILVLTILMK